MAVGNLSIMADYQRLFAISDGFGPSVIGFFFVAKRLQKFHYEIQNLPPFCCNNHIVSSLNSTPWIIVWKLLENVCTPFLSHWFCMIFFFPYKSIPATFLPCQPVFARESAYWLASLFLSMKVTLFKTYKILFLIIFYVY